MKSSERRGQATVYTAQASALVGAMRLWLVCLIAQAGAHMPDTTDDNDARDRAYFISDLLTKSWGIYVGSSGPTWYAFDGVQGADLSLSISSTVASSRKGLVNVVLHGPSAASIRCADDWTGWSSSRRLVGGEESIRFPNSTFKPAEFEPFGVGGYLPSTACHGQFPETGRYWLEAVPVRTDRPTYYTVGAGMVEAFTVGEVLTMSYTLYSTFEWAWGNAAYIVVPPYILTACVGFACVVPRRGFALPLWRATATAGAFLTLASPLIFTVQLIAVARYGIHMDDKLAFPLSFHIALVTGLVAAVLWAVRIDRRRSPPIGHGPRRWVRVGVLATSGTVAAVGAWQSYLIGPTLLMLSSIALAVRRSEPARRRRPVIGV